MSGSRQRRTGIAAGALGIASVLYFMLALGDVVPFSFWAILVPATAAVVLGVISIWKGRRQGMRIGLAVVGLSLALLTILLFLGIVLLVMLTMGDGSPP
jgi:asparagine N-glycosylation enzyme membrane subunit Stt3